MTRAKVHARYWGAILLGVAGLVLWDGVRRSSAGAGESRFVMPVSAATRPTARHGDVLRVATFNLASGRGTDGVVDWRRTEATIRQADPDVTGLQEARGHFSTMSDTLNLGLALGEAGTDGMSERRWWGLEQFGNGLLMRAEHVPSGGKALHIPLPQTQERGHRNVMVARLRTGDAEVTVLTTHIDRERDQDAQLAFVANLFLSVQTPAVLLGDMNVTVAHAAIRDLLAHADVREVGPVNPRRIELILVRGLESVGSGSVDLKASDHPLVWADVKVAGRP